MAVAVELASSRTSLLDVLGRVLDKGIVIDAWMRVALAGLEMIEMETRVVVASIDTYLAHADALALTGLVSAPVSIEPQFRRNRRRIGRRPPTRPLAACVRDLGMTHKNPEKHEAATGLAHLLGETPR